MYLSFSCQAKIFQSLNVKRFNVKNFKMFYQKKCSQDEGLKKILIIQWRIFTQNWIDFHIYFLKKKKFLFLSQLSVGWLVGLRGASFEAKVSDYVRRACARAWAPQLGRPSFELRSQVNQGNDSFATLVASLKFDCFVHWSLEVVEFLYRYRYYK